MASRILRLSIACVAVVLVSGCSWTEESTSDEILFVRDTAGGAAVYLMADDGRDVRRLVEGTSPRWSPDGGRFAYVVDDYEKTRYCGTSLWVMNPDSGGTRRVASADSICAPAWAPDGVRLAYSDGQRIVVVNTETGASEIVSLDFGIEEAMDWSPDGRQIIVTAAFSSKILDLRTGREREIHRKPLTGDGRWSPDGGRIALARFSPDPPMFPTRRLIVVTDSEGRSAAQVTRGAVDSGPAWSSDGKRIYFSRMPASELDEEGGERMQEIYVLDLETGSLRRLTANSLVDRLPDVRPPDRSLPSIPEPEAGDVVVPDLVGRYVLLEDEKRRFRELGLTLEASGFLLFREPGGLVIVSEQVPQGGARAVRGSVVKVTGSDLGSLYPGKVFSGPVWRAHPGCEDPSASRVGMYGDIVRRVLRPGMRKERVVSLLGKPERATGRWSDWALGQARPAHAPPIDCIYLRVEFDREGRATRFHQWAR